MSDRRIRQYLSMVRAMEAGRFRFALSAESTDGLGLLGCALVDLGLGLERKFRECLELERLTEKVNSGLLLEEVLDFVYDSLGSIVPFNRIGCALLEENGDTLRAVWVRSDTSQIHLPVGYTTRLAGSSLEEVLETRRPRILNDLVAYLKKHPDSESTRRIVAEGIRSSLTCPLVAMGRSIGFLFFSSLEPESYEEAHIELLQRIAGQLSQIIEKSRLYEELLKTKRELQQANRRLGRLASLDGLTGIANRRLYQTVLEAEWRRGQRQGSPLSLLVIDLDHFKSYNDRYGHQPGDLCLKRVARSLDSNVSRAGDLLARFGGEEFVAVLPNRTSHELVRLARFLRSEIAALQIPSLDSPVEPYLTVSLGGATVIPSRHGSSDELFTAADQALYEVKRGGRNGLRVVDLTSAAA